MNARRKNSKRLKRLRQLDVPINGDYELTAPWRGRKAGTRLSRAEQKEILAELGVVA